MDVTSVLLVINESALQNIFRRMFERKEVQAEFCSDANQAIERLHHRAHQIIYIDLALGDMDGIELVKKIKQDFPKTYILMGSNACTPKDVIRSMQAGAADFIVDPFEIDLVKAAMDKAMRETLPRSSMSQRNHSNQKTIVTQDRSLQRVLDVARKVAPSTANVLITGESGTGKELLAAYIHANSQRNDQPYIAVNCAALPEQLAESELFGHEKGAFTGAISRKLGKFEGAGNGTLVLDEITEMALPLQAKLLRAIQEREIVRLGSNRPVTVGARIIAISNRNIKKAVMANEFREDLYYRISVIPLTIPPLRERNNDIPLLANHFFERFSKQNQSTMTRISDSAMELLSRQKWPGNVRELENTIERGVLIGHGEELLPEHLFMEEVFQDDNRKPSLEAGMTVREMEKELIFNTLNAVEDNRTHAAKMLGISIRTLRNKLNEYREEMDRTG
ncbi:sigma-54-dependent transcriptional regulator [Desulfosarcina ovata]|uniref:Sigma-54-dependent Fis family transcriptional regulator n=1 Tax=Desulfosarcina ovata subsp. ovata TaxID=2752305 RepID=A0A5K8A703_9BACT|nr:sigma-54 dependent transcriptional regulator [Desulfosarcina ovata]BBO88305.1 sigma-54-dependent Fis family transcriptional regulator [Desulfosarcina ovata subsp. ovata]